MSPSETVRQARTRLMVLQEQRNYWSAAYDVGARTTITAGDHLDRIAEERRAVEAELQDAEEAMQDRAGLARPIRASERRVA